MRRPIQKRGVALADAGAPVTGEARVADAAFPTMGSAIAHVEAAGYLGGSGLIGNSRSGNVPHASRAVVQ
ncbi:MAG: hypothetical protein ACREUA_07725 [Burkholderiales bacterium]